MATFHLEQLPDRFALRSAVQKVFNSAKIQLFRFSKEFGHKSKYFGQLVITVLWIL